MKLTVVVNPALNGRGDARGVGRAMPRPTGARAASDACITRA
ncbi:esterase [Burkholderia pseudomallei]|nr:esterase [Burkholderia pseudomallei]ARL14322.1 esterase [Burkholderia pseudomallei]